MTLKSAKKPLPRIGAELRSLYNRVNEFQKRQFQNQSFKSKARHLKREVTEWMKAPDDIMEASDVFILTLACAAKQNLSIEELVDAAHRKMDINNLRRWSAPDKHGIFHHVEEGQ